VSPIGGATGGSGNLSISLSNVARLAAHPKFVWVFNTNYDGTIIYNDPVQKPSQFHSKIKYSSWNGKSDEKLITLRPIKT
jgi:hypothetical protein